MEQLEAVLAQSIQQYEHILDFLHKIEQEMGTADPAALQHLSISLNELQEQAMALDRILLVELPKHPSKTTSFQDLIARRDSMLQEVTLVNQRITAQASGVKSLLAHEIKKLRSGLSALSGYRQPQPEQGRITNCTS